MKTQRFEFRITVDVDEEDVRNFLGLDDDEEYEFDDDDFYNTAWDFIEREECQYEHWSTTNL